MTRHSVNTITSDALDALYADLDQARQRAANAYGQRDRLRHRVAALAERWQLPGHIAMPDAAAEIAEALDREQWAPCPDPIARVRALHQSQPDGSGFPDSRQCRTCSQDGGDGYQYLVPYPCPTVQALDQPAPAATEATEPREHCGDLKPQFSESTERTECVLRPGHTGSHADHNNTRWWWTDEAVAPPEEAPGA